MKLALVLLVTACAASPSASVPRTPTSENPGVHPTASDSESGAADQPREHPESDGEMVTPVVAEAESPPPQAEAAAPEPEEPYAVTRSPLLQATWHECVREFVEAQPEEARKALIDALATVVTVCDKVERRIVVHHFGIESRISLSMYLSRTRSKVWLEFVYHSDSWLFAERVKIAADDHRWTSPMLKFERDNSDTIWETAHMPLTKKLVGEVRRIVDAKEAVLRFQGKRGYDDVIVTEEMKRELGLMLEALNALKLP